MPDTASAIARIAFLQAREQALHTRSAGSDDRLRADLDCAVERPIRAKADRHRDLLLDCHFHTAIANDCRFARPAARGNSAISVDCLRGIARRRAGHLDCLADAYAACRLISRLCRGVVGARLYALGAGAAIHPARFFSGATAAAVADTRRRPFLSPRRSSPSHIFPIRF